MLEQLSLDKPASDLITSSIVSMPFSEPTLRPTKLLKSSQQITSNRQAKTLEGALVRPYNVDDLKASLEANVWHNRCIQFKATCSVGLGFGVWPKGTKIGVDEPYEEDQLRSLHPYLFQANEDESFLEIAIEMAMDRETVGDGWWEAERSFNGNLKHLYHVPGETIWLEADKLSKGDIVNSIRGYIQKINATYKRFRRFSDMRDIKGRPGELIRFKNPMIGNAWYGTPDWLPAIRAIALALSAHDFNYAFFANSAIPAWLMLVRGGTLSTQASSDFVRFFQQNFQGATEAHRMLKVESENKDVEIELKRITAEVEKMSFGDLLNMSRDEIISANGVPPRVMGISTPGKLGGGTEVKDELKLFKEITVRPKQKLLEDRINMTILAESGDRIKFNEIDIAPPAATPETDTEEALTGEGETVEKARRLSKVRDLIDGIMELRHLVIETDKMGDMDAIFAAHE